MEIDGKYTIGNAFQYGAGQRGKRLLFTCINHDRLRPHSAVSTTRIGRSHFRQLTSLLFPVREWLRETLGNIRLNGSNPPLTNSRASFAPIEAIRT